MLGDGDVVDLADVLELAWARRIPSAALVRVRDDLGVVVTRRRGRLLASLPGVATRPTMLERAMLRQPVLLARPGRPVGAADATPTVTREERMSHERED